MGGNGAGFVVEGVLRKQNRLEFISDDTVLERFHLVGGHTIAVFCIHQRQNTRAERLGVVICVVEVIVGHFFAERFVWHSQSPFSVFSRVSRLVMTCAFHVSVPDAQLALFWPIVLLNLSEMSFSE